MNVRTTSALAEAVEQSESPLPLLRLALENPMTVHHPKFEWTVGGGSEFNYVQTFRRYQDDERNDETESAKLRHGLLTDMEQCLEFGHRTINGWQRTMGGLRFFLPEGEPSEFRLAILRDLQYREHGFVIEWIAGVSVLVRP